MSDEKDQILTDKQECFCQEYIVDNNATQAAIRSGYSETTARSIGHENLTKPDIKKRIDELKKEIWERNKMTIDECVSMFADMARFDIADLYDENQNLKPIQDIPLNARMAIAELSVFEEYAGTGKNRELIGYTKKVKTIDKKGVLVELMKHLGGYERDNKQKTNGGVTIFQLPDNGR